MPDSVLYKFQSGPKGCMRVKFSNDGYYLLTTWTEVDSSTTMKFFELMTGENCYTYRGHKNIIHDVEWSLDDSMVITCSSD